MSISSRRSCGEGFRQLTLCGGSLVALWRQGAMKLSNPWPVGNPATSALPVLGRSIGLDGHFSHERPILVAA
jgi:hypothetical protein